MIGQTLSHYEVLERIGEGGMGVVYKARDTLLGRLVALKTLPAGGPAEPERRARLLREARAASALHHPNIVDVYDLLRHEGSDVIVMELVTGRTLDRAVAGKPIREVLGYARQIADALAKAHAAGIVHRDLKPSNMMVDEVGTVRILDFGLARLGAPPGTIDLGDASALPTAEATGTAEGRVVGTLAYMSPEQAEGKKADARSDVFSFGAVLYEMVTGRMAFQGDSAAATLAAVLEHEPSPPRELMPELPPDLEKVIQRCLRKDPAKRFQSMGDVALDLEEIAAGLDHAPPRATRPRARRRRLLWLAATTAALALVGFGGWLLRRAPASSTALLKLSRSLRFEVRPPAGGSWPGTGLALSPDGRSLAFSARGSDGRIWLWVRSFDSVTPRRLEGTEDAWHPFWAPDGRRLGFFAKGELSVVDLVGGTRRSLARTDTRGRGASWGKSDVIVYAPSFIGGLLRIPASGGTPEPASRLDEAARDGSHRFPTFLPDGHHFLFHASAGAGSEPGDLCLGELGSFEVRRLATAHSAPVFLEPDLLLFVRGSALVAQRLDQRRLELRGDPVPLVVGFPHQAAPSGFRPLSAAAGVVAYRVPKRPANRLEWVDRGGRETGVASDVSGLQMLPRLSPDGRRIAVGINDGGGSEADLWVLDPEGGNRTRLTFDARDDWGFAWSPDGRQIAFTALGTHAPGLYLTDPDRPGQEQLLWTTDATIWSPVWLPDGKGLLVEVSSADRQVDIWRVPLPGAGEPAPFLATSFDEGDADVSPDGRFVAYASNSSGRDEVYVRATAGDGDVWTISTEGGGFPSWRRDGRELFYWDAAGRMVAVPTMLTPTFSKGKPAVLFAAPSAGNDLGRNYDVAPGGERFLLPRGVEQVDPIVVVFGWAGEIADSRGRPR